MTGQQTEPRPSVAERIRRRRGPPSRMVINLVALIAIILVLSVLSPQFLTAANAANVLRQVATVVTVGAFFTLLLVAGGIDLSIGGVLALSGVVAVMLTNVGVPIPVAFVVTLGVGALVGLLNGVGVAVLGVNTVIATLAVLYLTRGIALVLAEGGVIRAEHPDYAYLGNATIDPLSGVVPALPVAVLAMIVALMLALIIERRAILGRYSVLVGSNAGGAGLSGVPVRRTRLILFVLTGVSAAWAGIMVSSRLGSAVSSVGIGFEFQVLIATLIGGTSLLGGYGSVLGLLVGALMVGCVTSGMNILGVQTFMQQVLLGLVLLIAVGLDAIVRFRAERTVRPATVGSDSP